MSRTRRGSTTEPTVRKSAIVSAWRNSVFGVFTVCGFALASWVSRLPTIRDELEASTAQLGVILLGLAIGSVLGLLSANQVIQRLGPRATATAGLLACAASLFTVGAGSTIAHSSALVFSGLLVYGAGAGVCNVAMNIEGAAIERQLTRSIMPLFHASYSLGSVLGAALGALAASIRLDVAIHLSLVAVVVACGALWPTRRFRAFSDTRASEGDVSRTRRRTAWLEPRTLLIGLIVMSTSFAAGAASDWLALAMVDGHGVGVDIAAMTYGIYVVAVTLGRLGGILLLDRFGRVRVLQGSAAMATIGLATVVFAPHPAIAMLGALFWGLGTALGFPVGLSAAADDPERGAARIGVVATIGYGAMLIGPPMLGFVGERVGLLNALLVVLVLALIGGIVAPAARKIRR